MICIRGQTLQPKSQLAFARRFGTPMIYPFVKGLDQYPEITPVIKEKEHKIDEHISKIPSLQPPPINDNIEHTASEGVGPVHALNMALKKALLNFYPQIKDLKLIDYKVRVLNTNEGSISKVRVLVESKFKDISVSYTHLTLPTKRIV